MAYTHFYELYKRVSRARRKEIVKFIHEVKKLSGRKYHCFVLEMLENCDEDYLSIDVTKLDLATEEAFEGELLELADEYGIPRRNIRLDYEPYYTDEKGYVISLYTDY